MEKLRSAQFWKQLLLVTVPKGLLLYAAAPALLLWLLAEPIGRAVRASDPAVFLILLGAAGAVCLNWYVYSLLRRKKPAKPVCAYGVLCVLCTASAEHLSLPVIHPLTSVLAIIICSLALLLMLLTSSWLAEKKTFKPALLAALTLRVLYWVFLCILVYQIFRDWEVGEVTLDTWIYLAVIIVFIIAFFLPRILASHRRKAARKKAAGTAGGRIVQIIGETHLDRDDDLVTEYLARVHYTVNDIVYETRACVTRYAVRRFGREKLLDWVVPVHYNPANPADAYVDRIDRRVFTP